MVPAPLLRARDARAARAGQTVVYDRIEANVPLDDALFRSAGRGAGAASEAAMRRTDAAILAAPARPRRRARRLRAAARGGRPVKIDSETISGLGARNIGSATMSGRIAAHRRRARGRAADHLRRRGQRRRLEVGQRRHDLQAGLRQAAGPVDRRHRDRSDEPEDRLGRHRREPGRATASRSATASTSRPTAARTGRTWASRRPSASPRSSSIPTDTDTVYACAPGNSGATATSAASTRRPTAARPGRRSSRRERSRPAAP